MRQRVLLAAMKGREEMRRTILALAGLGLLVMLGVVGVAGPSRTR